MAARLHERYSPTQTKAELRAEVEQAQNQPLVEAFVAACALIAHADGKVSEEERLELRRFIRTTEPLTVFGSEEVLQLFDDLAAGFDADPEPAEARALEVIGRLRDRPSAAGLVVRACALIGGADGSFTDDEQRAAIQVCTILGLDPTSFGLSDSA